MNIYTIYKFTNKINGKSYIGKTNNLPRRINKHFADAKEGSNYYFHNALREYGNQNFEIQILFQSSSTLIKEKEFTNIYEPLLIKEHFSHWTQNGYNMTWGGEGFDSLSVTSLNIKRVEDGTNPFLKRKDGSSIGKEISQKRVEEGTHHFLTKSNGTSVGGYSSKKRVEEKTHHFLTRSNGTSYQQDRVEEGTHHFLTRSDGTSVASDSVKAGTHNFLKTPDGNSMGKINAQKRVKEGTHHFFKNKGLVSCYNKLGEYKNIPREEYYSQLGPKENWEWSFMLSKEGKKRKQLSMI